jgi:hypothetical protein
MPLVARSSRVATAVTASSIPRSWLETPSPPVFLTSTILLKTAPLAVLARHPAQALRTIGHLHLESGHHAGKLVKNASNEEDERGGYFRLSKTLGLSMRVRSATRLLASACCSCSVALSSAKIGLSWCESVVAAALKHNSRIRSSELIEAMASNQGGACQQL